MTRPRRTASREREATLSTGMKANSGHWLASTLVRAWKSVWTSPGQETVTAERIPFVHSDFRHLAWLGFVADADVDGVFYLDNISLEKGQP